MHITTLKIHKKNFDKYKYYNSDRYIHITTFFQAHKITLTNIGNNFYNFRKQHGYRGRDRRSSIIIIDHHRQCVILLL